jgi:hypothetical protein
MLASLRAKAPLAVKSQKHTTRSRKGFVSAAFYRKTRTLKTEARGTRGSLSREAQSGDEPARAEKIAVFCSEEIRYRRMETTRATGVSFSVEQRSTG